MITNFKKDEKKDNSLNMNDKITSRNFILEDRPIIYKSRDFFRDDMSSENNQKNQVIIDKSNYFDDYYQKKKIIYETPELVLPEDTKVSKIMSFEEYLKLNTKTGK